MTALRARRLNPKVDSGSATPTFGRAISCRWREKSGAWRAPSQPRPPSSVVEERGIGHVYEARYPPSVTTYEAGRRLRLSTLSLPMTEGRDLRALLRIFLDGDGDKVRGLGAPERRLDDTRRSLVQLGAPAEDVMNLAEGFENAASIIALRNLADCATVRWVAEYREIAFPAHVRRVIIYSPRGKAASGGIERGRASLVFNDRALEIIASLSNVDWANALIAKLGCRV